MLTDVIFNMCINMLDLDIALGSLDELLNGVLRYNIIYQ